MKSNIENFKKLNDESHMNMGINNIEKFSRLNGEIFWELKDCKTGNIQDSGHFFNVVTLDSSILIARLMKSPPTKNLSEPTFGIFALTLGTGDVGWDPLNPPSATNTQRSLYNELARKQITNFDFIDGSG
ncbi:MAG TPA: hypothetical protein ENI76_04435, partial [Ignavibacteria bacterium]|nr:hypothetical protein [Ignavibacteria bacterium]